MPSLQICVSRKKLDLQKHIYYLRSITVIRDKNEFFPEADSLQLEVILVDLIFILRTELSTTF